jgi:hypothetical protein
VENLDSCAGRPFAVLVDSNAAFMRADERYSAGEFATANDAVTKARAIIDEDLAAMARANPGIERPGAGWAVGVVCARSMHPGRWIMRGGDVRKSRRTLDGESRRGEGSGACLTRCFGLLGWRAIMRSCTRH